MMTKEQREIYEELIKVLKMAKPIVGAACASSSNESRPLRIKVYERIVAVLDKARA